MNRPLEEALTGNKIRRDLYHRIAHNLLHLPPLRDRLEDIPDLCDATLASMRAREVVNVFEVTTEVLDYFQTRRWPGNVRELQAVVENAAYHAHYSGRSFVSPSDLTMMRGGLTSESDASFHEQVERFKLRLVEEALARHVRHGTGVLGVPAVRGDAFGATRIGREGRHQPAMEQLVALTAQARLGRGDCGGRARRLRGRFFSGRTAMRG